MKKISFIILYILMIEFIQCEESSTALETKESSSEKGLIQIETISKKKLSRFIEATGEICLNETVTSHVTPQITGIIKKVNVDIGDVVKQGDSLFELSSVELGEALRNFIKFLRITELSRTNYEREKSLFDKKISSELDFIEAEMKYEENKAETDSAKNKLLVLGMNIAEITDIESGKNKDFAGQLPFRSPINGTIVEKHASIGELVEQGKDIMLISDLLTLWIWFDIYEKDIAFLNQTKEKDKILVKVQTEAFPDYEFQGTIDKISPMLNPETRTIKARVIIENKNSFLKPGMFCKGKIMTGGKKEDTAILIPAESLFKIDNADFVFIQNSDAKFEKRAVTIGFVQNEFVEIISGLKEGEKIVTKGAYSLKSELFKDSFGGEE